MKTNSIIALVTAVLMLAISCSQRNEKQNNKQENSNESPLSKQINSEIEKWQTELLFNGEVGPPCGDDYQKWMQENPDAYFGLPEKIESKTCDFNNDGKQDILLYFPAGSPCNGGNGEGSDFTVLIFSKDNEYLYNKNLTSKIESKINEEFSNLTNTYSNRSIFSIKGFNNEILGEFTLWLEKDAHCCPSYGGSFKYNLITRKMTLNIHKTAKQ